MPRVQENDGQEIIYQDLNRIHQVIEREVYERLVYQVCGRTDGFFQDSFAVSFVDATHVSVKAGLAIQLDNTQVDPESTRRPIYLGVNTAMAITTPDGTNPRIDIVCVKADRVTTKTESRQVKDFVSKAVSAQSLVTETDWLASMQIVAGTPAGSPVAPATPSGYIKIGTLAVAASTGMASQASITDNRTLMPILDRTAIDTSGFANVPTKAVGTALKTTLSELDVLAAASGQLGLIYDAIVGSSSYATHSTLASAILGVSAGARILVTQSATINTAISVNKANLEIHLKPGVVLSKGSATIGLDVSASGVEIHGGKISGFSTAGDKAIRYQVTATYGKVWGMRQTSNDTFVDDSLVMVEQYGNIEE